MCTGGRYDHNNVVRALVWLDRCEMRPGTSGPNGKTVPIYYTDLDADASEAWKQPGIDQPHWNEVIDALQEDAVFCEDGETTTAHDGAIAIPGVFYITDDGPEATVEEDEVPQVFLQDRPAFRHLVYRAVREDLNASQKARGFLVGREQGPLLKCLSIQQLKLRTRCARCRKLRHWARQCPEGNRGQRHDERYDRRLGEHGDNSKGSSL